LGKTYEDIPVLVSWKARGALDILDKLGARVHAKAKKTPIVKLSERTADQENFGAFVAN
jgi:hypothetical protein